MVESHQSLNERGLMADTNGLWDATKATAPTAVDQDGDHQPDDIEELLLGAASQYRQGNFKAAMERGATALNILSRRADINGGGWS